MTSHSMHWTHSLKWFACALFLFSCLADAAEKKEGAFYGGIHTEYPSWFKASFLNLRDDIAEAKSKN